MSRGARFAYVCVYNHPKKYHEISIVLTDLRHFSLG